MFVRACFLTESRFSICSKRLHCWSPYQVRQKHLYIVTTTIITTTTPITTITTTTTTYVMRLIADSLLTPSNPYLLIDSSFHRNFRDFVAAIVEFCSGGGRTYWCRVHWRFEWFYSRWIDGLVSKSQGIQHPFVPLLHSFPPALPTPYHHGIWPLMLLYTSRLYTCDTYRELLSRFLVIFYCFFSPMCGWCWLKAPPPS